MNLRWILDYGASPLRPAALLPLLLLATLPSWRSPASAGEPPRPNVIIVLADDLGYGELGSYGQRIIQTPNLDRMASEGLRFTEFYAGASVCAPSRSVLMTGQHLGHTWVRGNSKTDVQFLRPEDETIAEHMKAAGYATALIGKWGLGDEGSRSKPTDQGFDYFYGYLDQKHAHNYFPTFLIRNDQRVPLRNLPAVAAGANSTSGAGWSGNRVDYSHDLFIEDSLEWIDRNHERPFFLVLALTIPHANNEAFKAGGDGQEVPEYGEYQRKAWSDPDKGHAAMITRMDRDVGRLIQHLDDLDIDEETLVVFTSDNGHHDAGGNSPEFFAAGGGLRGKKRDLFEGGIRIPMLVRWPGSTPEGRTSDLIAYQGDIMATLCDLTNTPCPESIDSLSLMPALLGEAERQERHPYLYWEFYDRGSAQALRFGRWKAIRAPMYIGGVQLYDLDADRGETRDVAAQHPELVSRAESMMTEAHTSNPNWELEWWEPYYFVLRNYIRSGS